MDLEHNAFNSTDCFKAALQKSVPQLLLNKPSISCREKPHRIKVDEGLNHRRNSE